VEQQVRPLVRSNGRHFDHRDLVERRQEGFAKQEQRHPKLKIVLKVSNQCDALKAVFALCLTDRRAMLHYHDARLTSTSRHHSSSM
jgi:hypothetical protein